MSVTNSFFYFVLSFYRRLFHVVMCRLSQLSHFKKYLRTSQCSRTRRGTAGFDNSGRGYYFANRQGPQPYPPTDPYDQAQRPPPQTHLNPYNPRQPQSQHTTQRIPPEFYQGKPAQPPVIQTVSSGAIGTVDTNPSTNNKNSNKEIDDKEKMR